MLNWKRLLRNKTDSLLRLVCYGRIPVPKQLYQLNTRFSSSIFLRCKPGSPPNFPRNLRKEKEEGNFYKTNAHGTLLVLEVANDLLWEQWVKVLYTGENFTTVLGWLPYGEFNLLVDPLWYNSWEDDETQ